MWVFDGEEWTEEGVSSNKSKQEQEQELNWSRFRELVPELQIVEITPLPAKNRDVPPLPMP